MHPVDDAARILVRFNPPAHPKDHGPITHLVVERVHRLVGENAFYLAHGADDDLARLLDVGAVGDAHVGLDAVSRVGIGVVDHLVLADDRVGHDHHAVVPGADARGAQADLDDVSPGALLLDFDPVANAEGLVDQDDKAADGVGDGVLGRQRQGQATKTQQRGEGGDVDPEIGQQNDDSTYCHDDPCYAHQQRGDRCELVGAPFVRRPPAGPGVGQVNQPPGDATDDDQTSDKVDVSQEGLSQAAAKVSRFVAK